MQQYAAAKKTYGDRALKPAFISSFKSLFPLVESRIIYSRVCDNEIDVFLSFVKAS